MAMWSFKGRHGQQQRKRDLVKITNRSKTEKFESHMSMALKQIINIFYYNKVKSVEIWALGSIRNDKKMA